MKRINLLIILVSFITLNCGGFVLAQKTGITLNSKDTLSLGERIVIGFYNIAIKGPGQVIKWIFQKIWQIIEYLWQKIISFFKEPKIKEEFEKEKQEIKQNIPQTGKSLWERIKGIFK